METDLVRSVKNLLVNCGGLSAGDKVLVLYEPEILGYYDAMIVEGVREGAKHLGIKTELVQVPFDANATEPDSELLLRMQAADRTLFLARMGDQIRFRASMKDIRPIVSYALDGEMLASAFGQADYGAFVALKDVVNTALAAASEIHVTCPLGTDFRGSHADFPQQGAEVTVARFPMSVHTPVPASNFAGSVAQTGFLVGTGSRYYDPYMCELEGTVLVEFEGNQITGFRGSRADVDAAQRHYQTVADRFGIEKTFVHSWHAGIHPGCAYTRPASASFERWTGGAFGNPRLLHFHTCGAYAPGEISLNVLDPTVSVDGIKVWDQGRLHPERIAGGADILKAFPDVNAVFEDPAQNCGLGEAGKLSFV